MKPISRNTLAAAFFAAGLAFAAAAPLASAQTAPQPQAQANMQSRQQARLDWMAQRLQITAAQQDAWQAYVQAHKEMFDSRLGFTPPPNNADAATLTRDRAERVAQMAQKLTALADATAKLQSALTPEQSKTLADMTRSMGARYGECGGGAAWGMGGGPGRGQGAGMGRNAPGFQVFDLNGDGVITSDEFDQARSQRINERAAAGYPMRGLSNQPSFDAIDTNHDGAITPAEFQAWQMQRRQQAPANR